MMDRKKFYDAATQKILSKIDDLGLPKEDNIKARKYAQIFRQAFLSEAVRRAILGKDAEKYRKYFYDSFGFCRISSAAFAAVMGAGDWDLMCINKSEWQSESDHHYLRHVPTGKVLDLTYDQFSADGKFVPYDKGHSVTYGETLRTDGLAFANAAGIDIIEVLKENSRRGK